VSRRSKHAVMHDYTRLLQETGQKFGLDAMACGNMASFIPTASETAAAFRGA